MIPQNVRLLLAHLTHSLLSIDTESFGGLPGRPLCTRDKADKALERRTEAAERIRAVLTAASALPGWLEVDAYRKSIRSFQEECDKPAQRNLLEVLEMLIDPPQHQRAKKMQLCDFMKPKEISLKIWNALEGVSYTQPDLERILGKNPSTVRDNLQRMRKAEAIANDQDGDGYYRPDSPPGSDPTES